MEEQNTNINIDTNNREQMNSGINNFYVHHITYYLI